MPAVRICRCRTCSRIVDTANALKSDVIVMLGDYIARYRFAVERIPDPVWAAELARLQAPLGSGRSSAITIGGTTSPACAVRSPTCAFRVLENQAVLLGARASGFWLAGHWRSDRSSHSAMAASAALTICRGRCAQVTTDDPVILLAHEPDIFPRVPSRVALTLAGHTHGGQIRVPLIWPAFVPSQYGTRFAYGHIVEGERHMIVSGGLGTSIIPARFGVPPEIVHVTLGA